MKKLWLLLLVLLLVDPVSSQTSISSWGYQLQDFDLDILENSEYDLLVLDYSMDGSDDTRFSSSQISEITASGKTVISYISIGEAEDYRYYFEGTWIDDPPTWMDGENPDWEGNYKVQYWHEDWQAIVLEYIDKIIDSGFQGLYLDIIDAYEFYEEDVSNAAELMIEFVSTIASHFKTEVPDGVIIPQNGEPLLEDTIYRSVIDGIAREDLYILPDEQEQRPMDEIEEIEGYIDLLDEDQLQLVVDYTDDAELIDFARTRAGIKGYLHYVGVLDLDELVSPDYIGKTQQSVNFPFLAVVGTLILTISLTKLKKRKF